ncbi:MAG: hypothetical protein AB7O60_03645 [Variibacter sp.]
MGRHNMLERKHTVLKKAKGRSRITNGKSILPGAVDQRTIWVRRFKDLLALYITDLGGDDAVSEAERAIIRRAALLAVECERLETVFALAGEASLPQLETYARVSNSLRRLLESVGLKRRKKDITPPTLDQYLRRRPAEAAE